MTQLDRRCALQLFVPNIQMWSWLETASFHNASNRSVERH